MTEADAVLDGAGLTNKAVRDYVRHWAPPSSTGC